MAKVPDLRSVLGHHFAPVALETLVVRRARFPQWMRPDVENAVRSIVSEGSEPRFLAPGMRRSASRFRFPDLYEEGCRVATDGAAVFDEVDIGESIHVPCVQRGLWLTAVGGERVALLLEVTEGLRRAAVRIEVAAAESGQAGAESMLSAI